MALSRGMTALRAALGAVGGGLEGYAQMQELERRRMREQEALNYQRQRDLLQDRRQAISDAATLRGEERQAVAAGMVESGQYMPRGIAGGMDMPGATPRQPVFRQTIGGKEFVLPESPTVTKHRESLVGRALKRAEDTPYQWSDKYGVFLDRRTGQAIQPEDLPAPVVTARSQRAGGGGRGLTPTALAKIAQEEAAAEAIFNTPMAADSPMRQALMSAFNAMRENNPDASPQELMRAAVAATKSMKLPVEKPAPARGRGVGSGGGRAPTNPPPIPGAAATQVMPSQPPAVDPLRKFYDRGQR